jgi:hypothetical protein
VFSDSIFQYWFDILMELVSDSVQVLLRQQPSVVDTQWPR